MQNERLYPHKSNTRYWGLVKLREAVELVISNHFKSSPQLVDRKLLDFGCGDSPYKSLFSKHVREYLRADIPGSIGIDFEIDTDTSRIINVKDGSIDFVLSTQVLEHVVSPEEYLAEAYRITNNDGKLILSTHGFWLYHPQPNDFWRWTGSGLVKLLKDNNWEVIQIEGILGFASASAALFQDAYQPFINKRFHKLFNRIMGYLIGYFDKKYTPEMRRENACVYIVVAKKIKK